MDTLSGSGTRDGAAGPSGSRRGPLAGDVLRVAGWALLGLFLAGLAFGVDAGAPAGPLPSVVAEGIERARRESGRRGAESAEGAFALPALGDVPAGPPPRTGSEAGPAFAAPGCAVSSAMARLSKDPEAFYRSGLAALAGNRLDEAAYYFDQTRTLDPSHPAAGSAAFWLGEIRRRQGKTVEALVSYRKAEGEFRPEARYRFARLADDAGRGEEALDIWKEIRDDTASPHRGEAFLRLGRAAYDGGRFDEAAESLSRALSLVPPESDAAVAAGFLSALAERERGRLPQAEDRLTALLLHRPDHPSAVWARFLFGWVLLERGKADEAERRFLKFLEDAPGPEAALRARYGLVRAAAARNDAAGVKKALEALPPEAGTGPWLGWAFADLGGVLFVQEKYEEAEKAYADAVKSWKGEDPGAVLYLEAECRFRLGRYAEAADLFAQAPKASASASAPAAHLRGAQSARRAGDEARAASLLEALLAGYPSFPERDAARLELGAVYQKLGRADEARRAYEAVGSGSPSYADSLFARARMALDAERWDEAAQLFAQFRSLQPGGPKGDEAALALARAHFQRQALPAALAVLDELERTTIFPDNRSAARYNKGWMLVRKGQAERGRAVLSELVAEDPGGPFAARANYILGSSAFEEGRYEEALARFDEVVRLARGGPEETEALRGRADSLYRLGRYEKALAAYMGLSDTIAGLYGKALSLQKLGRTKELAAAVDGFERAAPADDRAGGLRLLLAQSLFDAGKGAEAAAEFEKAAKFLRGPEEAKARFLRGRSLALAGRDAEAALLFSALAGEKGPSGSEALRELAEAKGRMGEDREAYAFSAELAEREAGTGGTAAAAAAYGRASRFARRAGEWNNAEVFAEKALALAGMASPARREYLNDLGESRLGKGTPKTALDPLRAAQALGEEPGPEGLRTLSLLGRVLEATGRGDEALETYLRIGYVYSLKEARAAEDALHAADLLRTAQREAEARFLYEKLKAEASAPWNETAAARLGSAPAP